MKTLKETYFVNKYEIGYDDEMIGVYYGDTEEDAINACKNHIKYEKFVPNTPIRKRLFIAKKIEY